MTATTASRPAPATSKASAIVTAWLLCGVLDISGAFVQAWIQFGRTPKQVLLGVASGLWGPPAMTRGIGLAAIGLLMHFTVALTATLVFFGLSRKISWLRTGPLLVVGPLYGALVFCTMNYATLPLLSVLRHLYLNTAPRWPGTMSWAQLGIHLICVGLPIAWGVRRGKP